MCKENFHYHIVSFVINCEMSLKYVCFLSGRGWESERDFSKIVPKIVNIASCLTIINATWMKYVEYLSYELFLNYLITSHYRLVKKKTTEIR